MLEFAIGMLVVGFVAFVCLLLDTNPLEIVSIIVIACTLGFGGWHVCRFIGSSILNLIN